MKEWTENEMADEVIGLIPNRSIINLGIGLPTIIADRVPSEKNIIIHSENGVLGVKGSPEKNEVSPTLINAGKETISVHPGASYFNSAMSFGMIRGGHIDATVLGTMEVDTSGSLANWSVPGKKITGMGGAMDLVNGPKIVIVMSYHLTKASESKLVKECTLPLTGKNVVNYVVTNFGIFAPDKNKNMFQIIKLASDEIIEKLDKNLFYK